MVASPQVILNEVRNLIPHVILNEVKNPACRLETLHCVQGDCWTFG